MLSFTMEAFVGELGKDCVVRKYFSNGLEKDFVDWGRSFVELAETFGGSVKNFGDEKLFAGEGRLVKNFGEVETMELLVGGAGVAELFGGD